MAPAAAGRAPWALLAALCACLAYALIAEGAADSPSQAADGASGLPSQTWMELSVALIASGALLTSLYGNGLRLRVSRTGLAGLGLLIAFAGWAALSIAWSAAPDNSWAEANRVIAYALAVLIGMLLGSSLPRAAQRVSIAIGVVTVPTALYALGAKTLPGLRIGDFTLDHAASFNRLSEPVGYWNALALACVVGLVVLLRAAADPGHRTSTRLASLVGVFLFAQVVGLTYSRGGVIALVAGIVFLVVASRERVRILVWLTVGLGGAAVPMTLVLTSTDLSTDRVLLSERTDDAARVLVAVLVVAALLVAVGWALVRAERSPRFTPARGRAIGRPIARAAAVVLVGLVAVWIATGGAGRTFEDFRDVKSAASLSDPNRLLSSNSGNRWVWWEEAVGAWVDRPVAGWGAGSFGVMHLLYRRQSLDVQQPHSVPLQWLAEAGIVGFLLAAGAFGALLAAGLSRMRSLTDSPGERGAAAALLAVAAAWIAQAFFEWTWDIPGVTLPMFVGLGVLAARPRSLERSTVRARGPAVAAVAIAFVLVAVSALLPAVARVQSNGALRSAGDADATPDELEAAAAQADFAARLNPLAIQPLIDAATIASRRGLPDEARDYLLRAVRRQPYDAQAWLQLTGVSFETGDYVTLRRAAEEALRLDPRGDRTRGLAVRAERGATNPAESATATGAPLPTQVPGR